MDSDASETCRQYARVQIKFPTMSALATYTILTPTLVLAACLTIAKVFQNDYVRERSCNVTNFMPSISEITGIVPQVYGWRICITLVIGPRLLFAALYKVYFSCLIEKLQSELRKIRTKFLVLCCFWCNIVEILSLCGLAFISNRENYPIHEMCFVIFLGSSFLYMLLMIVIFSIFNPYTSNASLVSYRVKMVLFGFAIIFLLILLFFHGKHVSYCTEYAFSWFAVSEYAMIACFLGFHWTITLDFPNKRIKLSTIDVT